VAGSSKREDRRAGRRQDAWSDGNDATVASARCDNAGGRHPRHWQFNRIDSSAVRRRARAGTEGGCEKDSEGQSQPRRKRISPCGGHGDSARQFDKDADEGVEYDRHCLFRDIHCTRRALAKTELNCRAATKLMGAPKLEERTNGANRRSAL